MHDLEHLTDSHCPTKTETHLHTQEHNCSICDFIIIDANSPAPFDYKVDLEVGRFNYSFTSSEAILSKTGDQLSPRAPPVFNFL